MTSAESEPTGTRENRNNNICMYFREYLATREANLPSRSRSPRGVSACVMVHGVCDAEGREEENSRAGKHPLEDTRREKERRMTTPSFFVERERSLARLTRESLVGTFHVRVVRLLRSFLFDEYVVPVRARLVLPGSSMSLRRSCLAALSNRRLSRIFNPCRSVMKASAARPSRPRDRARTPRPTPREVRDVLLELVHREKIFVTVAHVQLASLRGGAEESDSPGWASGSTPARASDLPRSSMSMSSISLAPNLANSRHLFSNLVVLSRAEPDGHVLRHVEHLLEFATAHLLPLTACRDQTLARELQQR